MNTARTRVVTAALILALTGAACASSDDAGGTAAAAAALGPATPAATLRAELQNILGAHVVFAVSASGASLGGRTAELAGARAALTGSSVAAFANALGGQYDAAAEGRVAAVWRKHVPLVLDHVAAIRAGDDRARDAATAQLLAYSEEFGAAMARLTGDAVPRTAAAALLRDHISTLKAVIDTQHQVRPGVVIEEFTKSYKQMAQLASTLADGVTSHRSLEGDPGSAPADLRANLNDALGRHVALAAFTTGAALDGRAAERTAAQDALNGANAEEVAAAFTTFGPAVEKRVLGLWRFHIRLIVDYTTATAGRDPARQRAAVDGLTTYAETFGQALNAILPSLSAADAREAVLGHITSLKAVIDAQAAGNFARAYGALGDALLHMDHIARALAVAITAE